MKELAKYSITTGAVLDEHYMTVLLTNDARVRRDPEDRHSFMGIRRDDEWVITAPFENALRSQAVIDRPDRCIISVSDIGVARRSTPQGGHQEANIGDASGLRVLGRTRIGEVRSIDGFAYVAGTRRAVYRRDAAGIWSCLDKGCYTPGGGLLSFRSIHGFSRSEIYAVGAKGDLWEFNGKKWKQHDAGTNAFLHKVLCTPHGVVYAAGRGGTIIRGRHSEWEILEGVPDGYEFWGLEFFDGRLFLTSGTVLVLELVDDEVTPVDFDECPIPSTAYQLSVSNGSLYSFGAKDIRRFDGAIWYEELTL